MRSLKLPTCQIVRIAYREVFRRSVFMPHKITVDGSVLCMPEVSDLWKHGQRKEITYVLIDYWKKELVAICKKVQQASLHLESNLTCSSDSNSTVNLIWIIR